MTDDYRLYEQLKSVEYTKQNAQSTNKLIRKVLKAISSKYPIKDDEGLLADESVSELSKSPNSQHPNLMRFAMELGDKYIVNSNKRIQTSTSRGRSIQTTPTKSLVPLSTDIDTILSTHLFFPKNPDDSVRAALESEPMLFIQVIQSALVAGYTAGDSAKVYPHQLRVQSDPEGRKIQERTLDAHKIVSDFMATHGATDWSYASILRIFDRQVWVKFITNNVTESNAEFLLNLPMVWMVMSNEEYAEALKLAKKHNVFPPSATFTKSWESFKDGKENVIVGRWRLCCPDAPNDAHAIAFRPYYRADFVSNANPAQTREFCETRYRDILRSRAEKGLKSEYVDQDGNIRRKVLKLVSNKQNEESTSPKASSQTGLGAGLRSVFSGVPKGSSDVFESMAHNHYE